MGILLKAKYKYKVPVDARCISPDKFSKLSISEIKNLDVYEGNRKRKLEELFEVETETLTSEEGFTVRIIGDLSKVKYLGYSMSMGKLIIEGPVGMHLGERMNGGTIVVHGDADSWVGSMMKNGRIEIFGDVGDYIGAAYRGSASGMSGGEIIIHGDASNEVGCYMRGGLIKIYGSVGQFTGIHMRNGTIFVEGDSKGRDGAQMVGGKLIIKGKVPSVLPSFTIVGVRSRVKVGTERIEGPFYLFSGDLTENGAGRLYISKPLNEHLNFYEKYLAGLPPDFKP